MKAAALHLPRTLEDVLSEIRAETAKIEAAELEWYRTRSDEASQRCANADTIRFELRAEAMNMVRDKLGVCFSVLADHLG